MPGLRNRSKDSKESWIFSIMIPNWKFLKLLKPPIKTSPAKRSRRAIGLSRASGADPRGPWSMTWRSLTPQSGAPLVLFVGLKPPWSIGISTINHGYWSYKSTWLTKGHHLAELTSASFWWIAVGIGTWDFPSNQFEEDHWSVVICFKPFHWFFRW